MLKKNLKVKLENYSKMPRKKGYKKKPRVTRKPQRIARVMSRQPYVETKFKESDVTYNLSGAVTHIPDCFEFMEQGDLRSQITGRWIFSKWMTQKLLIDFTPCVTEPYPITFNMMHGWLKINLNPQPDPANPSGPLPVAQTELQAHVSNYLRSAYEDPLAFGDTKRIKILSRKFIRGNPRIITNDGSGTTENFRQNQYHVLKWTPMRKIRYNHCVEEVQGGDDVEFMQCNTGNWVPFVYFHMNPQNANVRNFPQIKASTRHWFTDS